MGEPNLLVGDDRAGMAGSDRGRSLELGGREASGPRPNSSPFGSLVDLEIEHTIQDQEKDADKDAWLEWIPEIQSELKDRALSILGDRFKIEYMADQLVKGGCDNPRDIIRFIVENVAGAQQLYPKYFPIDALYKGMRDGTVRANV